MTHAHRIPLLFALASMVLAGCTDGWLANQREYHRLGEGDPASEFLLLSNDDDDDDATPALDDDDTAGSDDDDTTGFADDDDTTGLADDDDTTGFADDDDTTGLTDDDDTTGLTDDDDGDEGTPLTDDDDDPDEDENWADFGLPPAGDDDDMPSGTVEWDVTTTVFGGGYEFGAQGVFNYFTRTLEVENTGTNGVEVDLELQVSGPGPGMELTGPSSTFINPGLTGVWEVLFVPNDEGAYVGTVTVNYAPAWGGAPGPWSETHVFTGLAFDPSQGEFECTNGADDDNDGKVDCADPDCSSAENCGGVDICCTGDPDAFSSCADPVAFSCVCNEDTACCFLGWDSVCTDIYENTCASPTCG